MTTTTMNPDTATTHQPSIVADAADALHVETAHAAPDSAESAVAPDSPTSSSDVISGSTPAARRASLKLDNVGAAEARTIMSAEHRALGYRPPPGSLAAEAQAAAAKHPGAHLAGVEPAQLRELAVEDAARIASERKVDAIVPAHPQIDMEKIGAAAAKTLMSAEHKALGYRPPPGSLAAEAQAAAAKHPEASLDGVNEELLREVAREDAARIARQRDPDVAPTVGASIDLATIGAADAALIESAEHKALGYRPPPGSLAAEAHAAAAQHPDAHAAVSARQLAEAGRDDALRLKEERGEVANALPATHAGTSASLEGVDLAAVSAAATKRIQAIEQSALGSGPAAGSLAAGSLAAEARAAVAAHLSAAAASDFQPPAQQNRAVAIEDPAKVAPAPADAGVTVSGKIQLDAFSDAEAQPPRDTPLGNSTLSEVSV